MKMLLLDKPTSKLFYSKLAAWCEYKNELQKREPNDAVLDALETKRFQIGPVSICEAKTTNGNLPVFRDFDRHSDFLTREGIAYRVVDLSDIEGGVIWRS